MKAQIEKNNTPQNIEKHYNKQKNRKAIQVLMYFSSFDSRA
jgi:hypothetical protein